MKLKKLLLLLLILIPVASWAQQPKNTKTSGNKTTTTKPAAANKSQKAVPTPPNQPVTLICKIFNTPSNMDSITVYTPMGLANKVIAKGARRASDSAFVVILPAGNPTFYSVGFYENNTAKVIAGSEPEVTLWGHATYLDKARTVGSPINKSLEMVYKQVEIFRKQSENLRMKYYLVSGDDSEAIKKTAAEIKNFSEQKSRYLDSIQSVNPMMGRIASLYIYPEYISDKPSRISEIDFYGKEYFKNAKFSDSQLDKIPDVYNAFDAYTTFMLNLGASHDQLKQSVDMNLAKFPENGKSRRMALAGVVNSTKTANHQLYPFFTTMYLNRYRNETWGEIGRIEFEMKKSGTFSPGFEAPDLVGLTPDSTNWSLSKMRGKVVLVDFWASWCGPCRRENPNVVATYQKYKDKGFDILSVSLDRDANQWKKAIETDGLIWHHISDLKGWQSEYARLYTVNSIPATVLIDKEGKIIARNLRGEQLGEALKQIFGE